MTIRFRSSAAIEKLGATRRRDDRLAAAHLAFQAAADPEVLEHLAKPARAVPE